MSGVTPAFSYKILDFLNLSEGPKCPDGVWTETIILKIFLMVLIGNVSNLQKINFRKRFRNQNEKKLKNFETF